MEDLQRVCFGNDTHHTSTSIGRTALDAWQQWHKQPSSTVLKHGHNRVQGNNSIWEKPSETWLKCNVDVAFHDCNHITFVACGVIDSHGKFIRAQTKSQRGNMTVLEGEEVALLKALHFTNANRWNRVVFESDSCKLYRLWVMVKFVMRQATMVAHTLGRTACYWASHRIFYFYPSCIEH
ncbi:hypothetical protein MTR_7g051110 [Medicago truncatula]|uniref:RNase H type-1 domain-containing protein n=1 Tax=Medicago truncatula TaxID=3880 RepID=G7KWX6_MEDTR|nr:hypothetical protein MTR_7g051110 [Medicago truncatula]